VTSKSREDDLFDLLDLDSGLVVGQLDRAGHVVADDPLVGARVRAAFARELMVRDGEVVEELGVCFADVAMLRPDEPGHAAMVFHNLGRLAGCLPIARSAAGR
jgi:hypothetical protein